MTLHLAFDSLLALILLWSAWQTLATPQLDRAVILYIVFGLLLTLVWARLDAPQDAPQLQVRVGARLDAPDIALAEAALGAGLTGTLLLDALAALRRKASRTAPTPPETQP